MTTTNNNKNEQAALCNSCSNDVAVAEWNNDAISVVYIE